MRATNGKLLHEKSKTEWLGAAVHSLRQWAGTQILPPIPAPVIQVRTVVSPQGDRVESATIAGPAFFQTIPVRMVARPPVPTAQNPPTTAGASSSVAPDGINASNPPPAQDRTDTHQDKGDNDESETEEIEADSPPPTEETRKRKRIGEDDEEEDAEYDPNKDPDVGDD
jgi:hypothetical protein